MATKYKRYWYTSEDHIAIVEGLESTRTKNYTSTNIDSVTVGGLEIRVHSINLDAPTTGSNYDALTDTPGIPLQFHEALAFKIIAQGYEDPRNQNLQNAQYFKMKYDERVREAKKYAKRGMQRDAYVKPVEY